MSSRVLSNVLIDPSLYPVLAHHVCELRQAGCNTTATKSIAGQFLYIVSTKLTRSRSSLLVLFLLQPLWLSLRWYSRC